MSSGTSARSQPAAQRDLADQVFIDGLSGLQKDLLQDPAPWNRRLTQELLRQDAETLSNREKT
jgi:hypothetical protein